MSLRRRAAVACAAFAAACDTSRAEVIPAVEEQPATNLEFSAARAAAANDFWRTCCARLWRVDAGARDPYEAYYDRLPKAVKLHLAYDPALGTACITGLRAAAAACALTLAASESIDRACFGYRGTLPPGAECTDAVECAVPAEAQALCLRASAMVTSSVGACAVAFRGADAGACDACDDAEPAPSLSACGADHLPPAPDAAVSDAAVTDAAVSDAAADADREGG